MYRFVLDESIENALHGYSPSVAPAGKTTGVKHITLNCSMSKLYMQKDSSKRSFMRTVY